ncbi:MAG: Nudix family hydrolase [Pseudomonadota bacterium]
MDASTQPVEVVAGVIRDAQGRVLVSRRPPGRHLENLWEFPGGKREPGESHAHALQRELQEELGIDSVQCQPLVSVTHHYPEKTIRLWLFEVTEYAQEPYGREGQDVQWVPVAKLAELELPAADRPLVKVLPLDGRYAISLDPTAFESRSAFFARWQACLQSGFRLLRLRAQGDGLQRIRDWLPELNAMTHAHDARWLVSGNLADCLAAPADGIHLNRHQLSGLTQRPVPNEKLLAASCHNTAEIEQAEIIDADFVLLSPVQNTPSHPQAQGMGWDRFSEQVAESPLPVFALGGLQPQDLDRARSLGAFGVAGISNFGWSR